MQAAAYQHLFLFLGFNSSVHGRNKSSLQKRLNGYGYDGFPMMYVFKVDLLSDIYQACLCAIFRNQIEQRQITLCDMLKKP